MTDTRTVTLAKGTLAERIAVLVAASRERINRQIGQFHYHAKRRLADDLRRR